MPCLGSQVDHHKDRATTAGQLASGRGVVLPIAVSPHGGVHESQVARQAGCSSLLKRNLNSEWGMDLQPV